MMKPALDSTEAQAQRRQAFEQWLLREHLLDATWDDERNCYREFPAHLAFKAWCASADSARQAVLQEVQQAQRPAIGALYKEAADLAGGKALRPLELLEDRAGRTLGRRALVDSLEQSSLALKTSAVQVARAIDGLALEPVRRSAPRPEGATS